MHIRRERLEVVKRKLVHEVARADYVRNLPWDKQRLELFWKVRLAMRDVHVTDDEHEHLRGGMCVARSATRDGEGGGYGGWV